MTHAAVSAHLLRHRVRRLREAVGVPDDGDGPRRWDQHAADGDAARGLLDRHTDNDAPIVDADRLRTADGEVIQCVLQIQGLETDRVHDQHDARSMHWHQAFRGTQAIGLVGQHLVRGGVAARLEGRLSLGQVGRFRLQGVVGTVEIVDEECESGRVGADEAALDLGLAADLHRGDQRDQQGDQPDADGPARGRTSRACRHGACSGWSHKQAARGPVRR